MNSLIRLFKGLVPTRFLPSNSNIRESQALTYSQETALNTYIEQVLQKVRSELVLEIQAEDELLTEIIGKILRNIQLELNCEIRLSQLEEQHCEPKYSEITWKPNQRREISTNLIEKKLEVTGEAIHDRQGPVIEEVVQKQVLLYNISGEKITEVPEVTEFTEDTAILEYIWSVLRVVQDKLLEAKASSEQQIALTCRTTSEDKESSEQDFLVHLPFERHLTAIEEEEDLYTEIETCATFGSVCSETATICEEEDCSVHLSFETHLHAIEENLYTQLETCPTFGSVSSETIRLCEEEDSVVHLPINNSPDVRQTEVFYKTESCISVGALPSESVSSDTEKEAVIEDVVDSVLNKIVHNVDSEEVSGYYSLPKFSLSDNSMPLAGTSALGIAWIKKGVYSEPYLPQVDGVALQDTLSCPLEAPFPQTQPAKDTTLLKKAGNGKQKPNHCKTDKPRAKDTTNRILPRTENANARKRGSTYINSEATDKEAPKALLKMVKVEKGCKGGNNSGEMCEIDDAGMTVFGKPVKKFKKAMKRKGDFSKDEKNAGEDSGTKTQDGSKSDGDKTEHRGAVGKKTEYDGNQNIASIKETCDTGKIKDETTIATTASNTAKQNDIVDTSAKDDVIQQKSHESLVMKDSGVNNQFGSTSKPLKNNISSNIPKQQEATYHLKTPTSRLPNSKKRPLGKIPSLKKPKIVVRPTKGSHAARTVLPPGDSSGGKTTGPPNMAFGHKLPPIKDPDGLMVLGKKVSENKKPSGAKTKQRKHKTPQKPIWERYKKPVANIGECHSDTTASSNEVKKVTRLRRNKTISDPVTLVNENSGEQVANNESETVDDKENHVKEEWECLCGHTDPPFKGNLLDLSEECSDHVETPVGNTVIHDVKRVEQIRRQLDMSEENIIVQSTESEPAQDKAKNRSLSDPTKTTNANLATVTEEAECILIDLGEHDDANDFEVEVNRQTQSEPCYFTFDLLSDFSDSIVDKSDSAETLVSEDLLLDLQDDCTDNEPVLSILKVPEMVITAPSSELNLESHEATRMQEQNTSLGDTVEVYEGLCQLLKTESANTPSACEKPESPDKLVAYGCSKAIANTDVQGEEKAKKASETIKPNSRNSQDQPSGKSPKVGLSFPETKGDLNKLILMNLTEFGQKTLQQQVGQESTQSTNTKTANETHSEVCEEPSKVSGSLETEVCADGGRALKFHGKSKSCKSNKSLPVHPNMTTAPEIDSGCLSLSANGSSLSLNPCLTIRSIRNNTKPDSTTGQKTTQVKEKVQETESERSADKSDQLVPGTDTLLVIQGKKKVGMPSSNKSFRLRAESLKKLNEEKNQEETKPGAGSRKPKSAIRNITRVISEKSGAKQDQTASNSQEGHETATGTTAEGKLLTSSTDSRLTKKHSNSCVRTHPGCSRHGLQPSVEKDESINTKLSTGGDQTVATDLSACQVCNTQAKSMPKDMTKNPYSLTEKPFEIAQHCSSTPGDKEGPTVLDEMKSGKISKPTNMHKVAKGGRRHANKEICQKILQSYLEKREEFRALRQEDRHMRIIRWLCETNSYLPQSSPYFSAQVYFFNVEIPGPRQQLWASADEQDKESLSSKDGCSKRCSCVNNNGCLQSDRKTTDNLNEGGKSKYKPLLLSLLEAHRQRLIKCKPDITTTDLLMDKFPVLGPVLHQNPFKLISLKLQNKDRFDLQGGLHFEDFWKSKPQLVMSQPQKRDTNCGGAKAISETCPTNGADSRSAGQCNISAFQTESFMILLKWLIEKFRETSTFILQQKQDQQRASSVVLEASISEEQIGWYSVIRSRDVENNMMNHSGRELSEYNVKHKPDSTPAYCDKLDSLTQKCPVQATCSGDPKLSNGCDETIETVHDERQYKSGEANRTSYEQCTYAVSLERQCPGTQISVAKKGEATSTGQLFEMTDLRPRSNKSKRGKLRILKKGSKYIRDSCLKTSEVKDGSSGGEDTDCPDVRNASGRKRRVAGLFDCLSDRTCRARDV